jgi:hypothetical protein
LNNVPGSGNLWKKKLTVPKEFNLRTEQNKGSKLDINNNKSTKVIFFSFKV